MNPHLNLLQQLFQYVVRENASDLHLSASRKPVMRVNGELITLETKPVLSKEDTFSILKAIVSERDLQRVMDKEEIDFAYTYEAHRMRATAYIQQGNISMTFRLISEVKPLDELKLPSVLKELADREQGLILIVGPVGQGKSTTLASMIDYVNETRKEHVVTIEDPIEYTFKDKKSIIHQRTVGLDTQSFESGLSAIFRQDVNVIMVGEMRDPETIATVVTAAETGHLVLSTLHTNNASQTIDRIVDSFPGTQQNQVRAQLASSLVAIFSQRLIPDTTGGLVPAYELMINSKATANLIREGRTHEIDTLIETGQENGMIDMNHSLLELVREGRINIDDAYQNSLNPKLLDSML